MSTQWSKTEEALDESEARYRAVVEHSPDGVVVAVDNRVVYVNPAAVRLTGAQAPADVLGRSVFDFLPERYRAEVERRRTRMLETGSPAPRMEGQLRRLDGRLIDAEWTGVPLVYGGQPAILNYFRDTTEHRRQAQALQVIIKATASSGEEFFRALVSELGKVLGVKYTLAGMVIRGEPRRIRTVALWRQGTILPNCEYELSGTPCDHVVGRGLCHYPDQVQQLFPGDKMLAEMGVVSYLGIPLQSSSGAVLGHLCVMDDQPMPNRELANSLLNIFAAQAAAELERKTALDTLKASEAKYRQLHDSMMDAFAAADLSGRITDCNATFRKLLGYEPGELQQLAYQDFTPEKWHAAEAEIIQQQVLTRGYSDLYEKEYRRKDGTVFPVELRTLLLRDDAGTPYGLWAVVRDITERTRAAQALHRQLAFDELITRLLTRFASGVGPELDEHICTALEEIGRFVGVEHAVVFQFTPDLSTWSTTHEWGAPGIDRIWEQYRNVPFGTFPWIEGRILAGEVVQIHSKEELPAEAAALYQVWETHGFKATLQVPLRGRGGRVQGCIGLFAVRQEVSWTPEDLGRLRLVGDAIANVLERQRAEEALRQSEERLRFLFEQQLVGMAITSPSKGWVEVNDEICRMLGYSRAELEHLTWVDLTHPADRDADLALFHRLLAGDINDYALEKRYVRKDGAVVYGKIRVGCVRRADGSVYYVLGLIEDITERKRAERLLAGEKQVLERIVQRAPLREVCAEICRLIDELAPSARSSILLLDADGSRLWPAAAPHLPEAWNRAITPLPIGPQVGSCGTAAWRKAPVIAADLVTDPLWGAVPEYRDLALGFGLRACWSTPIFSAGGQLLGTFALYYAEPRCPTPQETQLMENVTHLAGVAIEHERATEALRRARDQLEQRVRERTAELESANARLQELDRLKSQFLATMSHELRTPLNSIIGFTGILQKGYAGPLNPEQEKQLGVVFTSAKHLLSLINDLLDLSRLEAGKVEIKQEPFNFIDVINEVVQNLQPMAAQKRLRLSTEVFDSILDLMGDRKRCFQVLLNLVHNAIKFTERGEVKISAWAEGDRLRVCVADTGIGIRAEQMGMLFEAFRQLDGTAKRTYEGTGLGLHLCRRLLELMRGDIGVESEPGKGSRFSFSLPRRAPGPPAAREREYENLKRG